MVNFLIMTWNKLTPVKVYSQKGYMTIWTVDFPKKLILNCALKNALLLRLSQLPHKFDTYTDQVTTLLKATV